MDKLLVKDKFGPVPACPDEDTIRLVEKAVASLSTSQYDRYCRARKVWFIAKTKTLEFEDMST